MKRSTITVDTEVDIDVLDIINNVETSDLVDELVSRIEENDISESELNIIRIASSKNSSISKIQTYSEIQTQEDIMKIELLTEVIPKITLAQLQNIFKNC